MSGTAEQEEGAAPRRLPRLMDAEARYRERLAEAPDDAEVLYQLGLVLFKRGDLEDAERLIARSVRLRPTCANALNDLGVIELGKGKREESIKSFALALKLQKDHTEAMNNMGEALKQLHRFDQASVILRRLAQLRPASSEAMSALAEALYGSHETKGALDRYHEAIRLDPDNKRARLGMADLCEGVGKWKLASLQYDAVLRRDPDNGIALSKLLQLPGGALPEKWLRSAERLGAAASEDQALRTRLNFALARYYDRGGQYDRAFKFLTLAHAHGAAARPFDAAGYTRAIDVLLEALPGELFSRAVTSGTVSDRPIFIVGMPRSGTTLVEQILCSHSRVAPGGELAALPEASRRIRDLSMGHRPYPWGLRDLGADQLATLARDYLGRLAKLYPDGRKVTDKFPFNFMHLGVIALALPDARIVHCRRDPRDTCLSCYFTSFADENPFANDLGTLGRYYSDYHRLMGHWHSVLPGRIFDLQYEELIANPEMTIRHLLGYCGLEWEAGCLSFHETRRDIRTPSRWQVRRPIYSGSVDRWRNYAGYLGPLERALAPCLLDVPQDRPCGALIGPAHSEATDVER